MQPGGLDTLFQNLGPTTASMFAGEREGLAQRQAFLENLAKQQAYDQAERMNPLNVQAKQLDIAGTEAENRKKLVEAALAEATQGNKLESSNLDMEQKRRENSLARMSSMAQQLNTLVPQLPMYGAAAPAAVRDVLVQNGMDPNNPKDAAFIQGIMSLPPQKLPEALSKFQNHLITTSEKYVTEMAKAKEHSRSAANVAEIGAKSREAAAAAKQKDAEKSLVTELLKKAPNFERAAASFGSMAIMTGNPVYQQIADKMEQASLKMKTATEAEKRALMQSILGMGGQVPTTPIPEAAPPSSTFNTTKSGAKYTIEQTP